MLTFAWSGVGSVFYPGEHQSPALRGLCRVGWFHPWTPVAPPWAPRRFILLLQVRRVLATARKAVAKCDCPQVMFVSSWVERRSKIALQSYVPPLALIPPYHCPKNRPYATGFRTASSNPYDDIVDHCCYAWNTLVDRPWKIMSIGLANGRTSLISETWYYLSGLVSHSTPKYRADRAEYRCDTGQQRRPAIKFGGRVEATWRSSDVQLGVHPR